jgi:hypothetical protein
MADVLENERNLGITYFSSEQIVMVVPQFLIGEMIPPKNNWIRLL